MSSILPFVARPAGMTGATGASEVGQVLPFSPRRRVPRHVTSFRDMCTLYCTRCEGTYNAPNPRVLHAQGVHVEWACALCNANDDTLRIVEGSERKAPPRG
jgi:hypothetical protein